MKPITPAVVAQITRNLIEFGYKGLTREHVQEQIDKLVVGEKPTGAIGMFTRGMLVENGYMEEEA